MEKTQAQDAIDALKAIGMEIDDPRLAKMAYDAGMTPYQYKTYCELLVENMISKQSSASYSEKNGEAQNSPPENSPVEIRYIENAPMEKENRRLKIINGILIAALAVAASFLAFSKSRWSATAPTAQTGGASVTQAAAAPTASVSTPQASPIIQNAPSECADQEHTGHIILGNDFSGRESTLKVNTEGDEDYYVCIAYPSGKFSFYVCAGDTVEMNVPTGTASIYFASGKTWYGPDYRFGETEYKADDIYDFTNYTYELTLYPVPNGNLETEKVNEEEFGQPPEG